MAVHVYRGVSFLDDIPDSSCLEHLDLFYHCIEEGV